MNDRALAALLAVLLALPAAALAAEPGRPGAAAQPAAAKVTIPVGGMTCGGCVQNVTSTLQKVGGVQAVEVSLEKRQAHVTYDAARVSARALAEAIREAGFEPGAPAAD